MFTVGQIVYCKVLDKCHGEKQEILLSLLPEDINSEVSSGAWAEGNVLMCAVEEEEDHGYLMESGVKGFRAFLPKKNVKTPPTIGEHLFCKIQKISTTAVTLTAFKKTELPKIETIDIPNLKTLVPGSIINFSIARILKDGVEGLIFDGSISAYANELYLPVKMSISDPQIIGKEMKARILYTMPLSNQIFVTLITDDPSKASKASFKFGTLVETAKVIKQTSGGVLMKLDANARGFLPRKTIVRNLKNNFDIDSALIKYSPNSIHVVRVMNFNPFENCYLCTNDGKLLHEKFFGTYDVEIGQLVQAKIEEKLNDGFRLSVGSIRTFLNGAFLNKSPKMNVGDEIRVRVSEIDHDAKLIHVTNLQGFIRDAAKILKTKRQVKTGESYTGVVMKESPNFFTILFFNHIKGQLPKTPETEADIISIGGLKVGSVKNFAVKYVKGDRITLSLPKKFDTQNLGKVFECKVSAVLPSGLQIFIEELKTYGKVSTNYLSEFQLLAPQIHANIKEGDKFEVVALMNNEYSRGDVEYFRSGAIVDFKDVNPGDVLRCFVKFMDDETIELECPLKNFNDSIKLNRQAFDDPANLNLSVDSIVYVSVIAKTESHHNSLYVTPALHKVWKNEMDLPLGMVQSYLTDISFLLEKMKKSGRPFGKFKIGQRISGTIKNIIGNNLLLEIEEGIFAQGTVENIQSFKIGGSVNEAVIVWLDPINSMIHVTLKDKCREEVSVDQKIDPKIVNEKKHKAIIVYFNDFVTVCTIRKSGQPVVFAPTKFHYNDFSTAKNRALGHATSKLVIKKAANGKLLGAFVQDYKIFQKVEKFSTKLGKRRADVSDTTASTSVAESKKSKVVLDASDDENDEVEEEDERKTETEDSDDDAPKPPIVLQKINESIISKGKKFGKSLKGTFKKSSMKVPMKPRNFINKDSMLDENLVNLVSFKTIKEGEEPSEKKHVRVLKKSTIGRKGKPKGKPKRLVKKN